MKDKRGNQTTNYIELLKAKEQSFMKMLILSWSFTGIFSILITIWGKRPYLSLGLGLAAFFLDSVIILRIILKWKMYNYICPYCKEGFKTVQEKNAAGIVVMSIPAMNSCPSCKKSLNDFDGIHEVKPCRKKVLAVVLVTLILEIVINGLFCLPIPVMPGRVDSFIENSESISVDIKDIDYSFDYNFSFLKVDSCEFLDETADKYYALYIYDTKENPNKLSINLFQDSYHIEANVNKDMVNNPFWGTKSHPIPIFDFQIRKGDEEAQENREAQADIDELNTLSSPQRTKESVKLYLSYGMDYWERFHLKTSDESSGIFTYLNHYRAKWHYDKGIRKLEEGYTLSAQDEFEYAVEYDPQYADAWLYLGVAYNINTTDGEDKAIEYIEKSRELYGTDEQKNALCDMKLGDIYLNQKDANGDYMNLSLARSYYEKASNVYTNPQELSLVYERIGETYKNESDYSHALTWLEKSNSEKENWDALYHLGDLYFDQENFSKALFYLEKARKMNPDKTFDLYIPLNICYRELGLEDSKEALELSNDYMGTGDKSWLGTLKEFLYGIASIPKDLNQADGTISFVAAPFVLFLFMMILLLTRWFMKRARKYQFKQKGSIFRPRNRVQGYEENGTSYQLPQSALIAAGQVFDDWEPKRKLSNMMAVLFYFILPCIVFYLYIDSLPMANELLLFSVYAPLALTGAISAVVLLRRKSRTNCKNNAISKILASISPDIIYHKNEGLKPQDLVRSEMLPGIITFVSEDLITGTYKNVAFRLADVSSSGRIMPGSADFMGRWITLDYNNKQAQDLYIYQKMQGRKTYNRNAVSVQTDNPNFNDNFTVYSHSGEEALYILTPHFMEAILRLEKSIEGAIVMGFTEGKLHVAIDDKKNHIEVGMWRKPDAKRYVNEVIGDLSLVYDFIDDLRLKGKS